MNALSVVEARLAEMEKKLNYMSNREASREQEELEKRDRQARRRARTRKPIREALFVKEYKIAQNLAIGDNFEDCRDRVCLLLLFLTGVRIGLLRLTTGSHLSKLLSFIKEDQQTLVYPSTKQPKAADISIPLPGEAIPLIEERSNDLRRLLSGRTPHDMVMCRTEGSNDVISLTNINKRLNRIMKKLSAATGKLFRTHSFRIGLATSIMDVASMDIAHDVLGHRDFDTTASYNRRKYSQKDLSKALGSAYNARRRRSTKRATCTV